MFYITACVLIFSFKYIFPLEIQYVEYIYITNDSSMPKLIRLKRF